MSEKISDKLAMAAPAALYITGAVCLGIFALLTERVPGSAIPVLVVWTQAAAVGIIIAGIIEIIRNEAALGVLILVSGTMLTLGAGWGFEASRLLPVELWEKGLQMCGYMWLGIGVAMLLLLVVAAKVSWGLFFSQIVNGAAAILLGWGLISRIGFGHGVVNIAGWLLLIYAIYAFYAATGFLVNRTYGRRVLPV